jgi:ABC-type transport system involved in multi-copper enzyme maturation permease subunit
MIQTLALFLDSYRDLNSRRMFWITLILSTLVAATFAGIGLTPTGFELLWFKFDSNIFNSVNIPPGEYYKYIFQVFGIEKWLTIFAAILALISTAGLFPDFIATGAVDLYLSKPISRLRLFLTKYFCGLLFVALQIACFCTASFLVIGIRGDAWEPGIFLAIPIVVLFFSYLFAFCVLVGVWTRSTVAAALLTLLFWFGVFCVHWTEITLLTFKIAQDNGIATLDKQIQLSQHSLEGARKTAATQPTARNTRNVEIFESQLQRQQTERAGKTNSLTFVHQVFYDAQLVLPKTTETVDLLEKVLLERINLNSPSTRDSSPPPTFDLNGNPVDPRQINAELRKRTAGLVIGTSVGFEVVVLAVAAWVFCRRDY